MKWLIKVEFNKFAFSTLSVAVELSILSKLLEKHIVNLLTEHLKSHAPLSQQEWGSLKANL